MKSLFPKNGTVGSVMRTLKQLQTSILTLISVQELNQLIKLQVYSEKRKAVSMNLNRFQKKKKEEESLKNPIHQKVHQHKCEFYQSSTIFCRTAKN